VTQRRLIVDIIETAAFVRKPAVGRAHRTGIPYQPHAALLFARPHDLTIVPTTGEHRLKGVVRRIHGIGPARRVEVALGGSAETLIEVDAMRSQQLRVGQMVGLRPDQYRLFPAGS
jgi:ABC-type sulfate/molybdate transport systems ATPase subunit